MGLITPCENRRPLTLAGVASYFKSAFEVRMKQPEPPTHLPPSYLDIFQMMESEGTLSVTRRRFFEDVRLKSFWEKVDAYTNSVNYQFNRSDVAGTLTGAFFISIEFYGQHGTADNPSPTGQIVQNQKEVDKLIIDALNKAGELLDIFERIQVKSAYYPEEIESLYFGEFNVSTRDVLLKLNHGLADYPTYKILF